MNYASRIIMQHAIIMHYLSRYTPTTPTIVARVTSGVAALQRSYAALTGFSPSGAAGLDMIG
jgi:hypothetical protein